MVAFPTTAGKSNPAWDFRFFFFAYRGWAIVELWFMWSA